MKTYRKYLQALLAVFVLLFVFPIGTAMAQSNESKKVDNQQNELEEIVGEVIDAVSKEPLAGVRVEALGNNRYTAMTKADGTFSIKLPKHVISLYVSTPGYESSIVKARQKRYITIALYDESFSSYVKNGFDVNSMGEATFDMAKSTTLETELQKQLGAQVRTVTRSGTVGIGGLMMMQGINTLNSSVQPLIVLDGVIQDLQDSYAALHDGFFNNTLAAIDVNDIEKITVLNNATSIYGAKGANGVILIDTKRGHSMATRIDAQAFASYTMMPKLPQMMNAEQYRIYANELLANSGANVAKLPFLSDDKSKYYYNTYHNETNWSDYVYQNAWAQNYRVNVQGGDDAAMYNFSLGFADGESTIKSNDFNRLNIRFNTDVNLAKILKTRFDIAYSRVARDLRDDGILEDLNAGPVVSPGFLALIKSPFLSPYAHNNSGQLTEALSSADDFARIYSTNDSYANPLSIFEYGNGNNKNNQEYTVFNVTVAPELTLGKGWTISTLFNYTLHRTSEKYFRPMTGTPIFFISGLGLSENEARSFFSKEEEIYSDTRINWEKKYGGHSISAFGGFRFSNFAYDSNYASGHNTGNDKLPDVGANLKYIKTDGAYDVWRNMSYYANLDYNFRSKYYLQGSVAAETSSRFGRATEEGIKVAGVCWGLFPSLQAGWLVSSEPFFNTSIVNYLKLTAGVDWSGNDNISNSAAFCYHENVKYSDKLMGLKLGNIENQSIQWETTRRLNVGGDLIALNNRIRLTGNFFYNETNNLLTLRKLDPLAGIEYAWSNGGALENVGGYVNANLRVLNTKNWRWEVGASLGSYKNVITDLPDETIINKNWTEKDGELRGFTTDIYGATILTAVNHSAGVFFGYETDGVFASTEEAYDEKKGDWRLKTYDVNTGVKTPLEAGDVKFVDQNGDGLISVDDRVIIGNPNPDFYGNINSNLSYKNFSLSATLNYSLGNDVYNYQRALLEGGSSFYNQTVAVTNRWKTEGHVTDIPKATYGDPKGNNRFSDRWIEDGSYIRLKDVTLSYKIPVSASWLQGLTVWCAGTNLLTFSKYLGSDPEFSLSNNVLYQGIDNGMLAQSRSFHIGVKINL